MLDVLLRSAPHLPPSLLFSQSLAFNFKAIIEIISNLSFFRVPPFLHLLDRLFFLSISPGEFQKALHSHVPEQENGGGRVAPAGDPLLVVWPKGLTPPPPDHPSLEPFCTHCQIPVHLGEEGQQGRWEGVERRQNAGGETGGMGVRRLGEGVNLVAMTQAR